MSKKLILIISITTLVLLATIGFLFYRNTKLKEDVRPIKEILQVQNEGELSESGKIAREKLVAPLGGNSKALLVTEDYEIGYLPPPSERLMVFIVSETPDTAEQDAISWIKSRGFSESDICNFPTVISGVGPNHLPAFCEGIISVE